MKVCQVVKLRQGTHKKIRIENEKQNGCPQYPFQYPRSIPDQSTSIYSVNRHPVLSIPVFSTASIRYLSIPPGCHVVNLSSCGIWESVIWHLVFGCADIKRLYIENGC